MYVYTYIIICIRYETHGLEEPRNSTAINIHEPPKNHKYETRVENNGNRSFNSGISLQHTFFDVIEAKASRDGYQKNEEKNKLDRVSNAAKRGNVVKKFIGRRIPAEGKHERCKHEGNQHHPFLIG